jgi:L,D-transpeptidase catalytic domain
MPRLMIAIAAGAALLGTLARAEAGIVVTVDKTAQRLSVAVDGSARYEWPVSTARWGYRTPNGTYRPQWLARKWFSRKYDWSPMPYSIFFDGGYAIHGSYEISHLGRPASHGCIRLHPENAAILFALVKENMKDTQIVVTGEPPPPAPEARGRPRRTDRQACRTRQYVAGASRLLRPVQRGAGRGLRRPRAPGLGEQAVVLLLHTLRLSVVIAGHKRREAPSSRLKTRQSMMTLHKDKFA